jgi:tRNA wybutosine-synthesizing protein 1
VLAECDPTQLYVSVDAADRKTFEETVKAVEDDAWERLIETMDVLADKEETRTVIRTTVVKGHNMHHPAWYAAMADRADADFVELKAYMHVGHSRGRLDRDSMPEHGEVLEFAESVQEFLPDHDVCKQVPASRVAMLATEEDTWVPKLRKDSEFWADDPLVRP